MPPPIQPRNARPAGTRNATHNRGAKVSKSLRELYEDTCREMNVHPNTVFSKALPDKAGMSLQSDVIDLRRNYIGDKGMIPVLHVVQRCPGIKRLVVTENGLRNAAVEKICAVAGKHPGLTSIDLSDNYISEGAGKALGSLLSDTPRIVDVGITNTKIEAEQRLRIKMLAQANANQGAAVSTPPAGPQSQQL